MRDDYIFAKFDVRMPRHPKIKPLSDAAFRCLVEATLLSREQRSDGRLSSRLAEATWPLDILNELCANDIEQPSLSRAENEYILHDYADYNQTNDEIEAYREQRRAAGRKGGLARAKQQPKRKLGKTLSSTQADKEKKQDKELPPSVISSEITPGGHARTRANGAPAPPPPCPKHPNGWDHAEPCRACEARRHWDEGATDRDRAARDERRRIIDNCRMCNHRGLINLGDRNAPDWQTCNHRPELVKGIPYYDGEVDRIRLEAQQRDEVPW